jgi:hypothetical protein
MLAGPAAPLHRNSNQMIIVTKNVIAFLGQALAWLGGQGTRAIAALVFIGIAALPAGSSRELLNQNHTRIIDF